MTPDEIRKLLPFLTQAERDEMEDLLAADLAQVMWRNLPGPQEMARNSLADIVGYGGSAGGGKTDLVVGLVTMDHQRSLVVRREKAQTEGIIQRIAEVVGTTDGFNSQKSKWSLPGGRLAEFAGLDNEGDERRWQGRPHDLKAFDEVTEMREHQVRFMMGWNRSDKAGQRTRVLFTFNPPTTVEGRWVIDFFGPWLNKSHPNPAKPGELRWFTTIAGKDAEVADGREFVLVDGAPCYEFDEDDYTPEQIIAPKSRTFVPARLTDNPYYMQSGYMSVLQAMPEPLRSQMLYGDFNAGVQDDPWQVIPTEWVEAAMARWRARTPRGEMVSMGVDVARGGKDKTIMATRHKTDAHSMWIDALKVYPGKETPDGEQVAGLVIAAVRDQSPIHIDVIGVGASPYDILRIANQPIFGVNVSEKAKGPDKSGRLTFLNQRSELWWRMREALDPANDTGICLPPDKDLLAEMCAPKWSMSGMTIKVQSREDIVADVGRSPDRATAVMLALIDTPKIHLLRNTNAQNVVTGYDPMANMRR